MDILKCWLLVGSIAVALISIALLMRIIQIPEEHQQLYRIGNIVMLVSGAAISLLGFSILGVIPILIIMVLLMIVPAFFGFRALIERAAEKPS